MVPSMVQVKQDVLERLVKDIKEEIQQTILLEVVVEELVQLEWIRQILTEALEEMV